MIESPAQLVRRVDETLAQFVQDRRAELADIGPELEPVGREARDFLLDGGKRLRPNLAYWGWRATYTDLDQEAAVVTAAASLELLHACALVHDDVMDDSDTRRGRPATHEAFASLHRDRGYEGDAVAFGTAAAILLGDLFLTWSDALFAASGPVVTTRPDVRRFYDRMRQQVMCGQYLDVAVQAAGGFSEDDALRVIEYKTSKYTVEGPLLLGAAIAGADAATTGALCEFALPLGQAFQLRDDVLGVFGDPALTGKPAGDDLREGKRTLLVALAVARADDTQDKLLRTGLGDRALDTGAVDVLRQVLVDTGALAEVERRIDDCAAAARTSLTAAGLHPDATEVLLTLVDSSTRRVA